MTSPAAQLSGATTRVVAPETFRAVMSHHAKGVAVITAHTDRPAGFCATSFVSLSLDPPLVSFAAGLQTRSWAAMKNAPHFLVHLLAEGQEWLARTFARSDGDKFGPPVAWHSGPFGLPMLDDVPAWLVLAPVGVLPVGDHALVIGRVVEAGHTSNRRPLVHHDGTFCQLSSNQGELVNRQSAQ